MSGSSYAWAAARRQRAGRSKAKGPAGSKEMPDVTFDDVAGEETSRRGARRSREFLSEPEDSVPSAPKSPGVSSLRSARNRKTLLAGTMSPAGGDRPSSPMARLRVRRGCSSAWAPRCVRDLFDQAKGEERSRHHLRRQSPAAVVSPGSRAPGILPFGNASRPSARLLVEMDDFDASHQRHPHRRRQPPRRPGPALLRPQPFDRQVGDRSPGPLAERFPPSSRSTPRNEALDRRRRPRPG